MVGPEASDPCAPYGPYPVSGQQVYIQDQYNFCIGLPDPASPVLQSQYYSKGQLPTIVEGEGNIQVYCVGSYLPPGALPMPAGAITAAHAIKNKSANGKYYFEVSGYFNCAAAGVSCESSSPGAGDDGGQYDTAPFRFCGKEPYSGTDAGKHPTMPNYVQQAGDGEYCIRVCEAGMELEDPCNVKSDTAGCRRTMGVVFRDGFSYTDLTGGTGPVVSNGTVSSLSSSTSSTQSVSRASSTFSATAPSDYPSGATVANGVTATSTTAAATTTTPARSSAQSRSADVLFALLWLIY
ncbi:hypothetical protein HDU91_001073 [Kappamyces sp. JEL0680]|nr:hypothetical protein HDU91_001073 [Kappamyces sp. JEL0680]